MKAKWYFIVACAVAAIFTATTHIVAAKDDGIHKTIEAASSMFMLRLAAGDTAGIAALYTQDAMLLPPGSDFVSGRDAIEQFWASALTAGPSMFFLETREVDQIDNTAIEVGTFRLTGKEGVVLGSGKYIFVWKNVDGDWKLHRDIWNRNE